MLAFFLALGSCYQWCYGRALTALKKRNKRGLRHVLSGLNQELTLLGLVSLLLIALEVRRRLPVLLAVHARASLPTPAAAACAADLLAQDMRPLRRRCHPNVLLGVRKGGDGSVPSCYQSDEACGAGSEPFWSQLSLVQAHAFICVIAVTHLLYAGLAMALCLWKLGRWRRYEAQAKELRPLRAW